MTDAFKSGYDFGAKIGGALGNAQRQRAYGDAYKSEGWQGLGDLAGANGDLETAQAAQTQVTNAANQNWEKAKRNLTITGNLAKSIQTLPYEQRKARIAQMGPVLKGVGFDDAAIQNFDPTDEALQGILAQTGQFSKYADMKEVDGVLYGIGADGYATPLTERKPPKPEYRTAGRTLLRVDENGAEPVYTAPSDGGGFGRAPAGYRYTPDGNLEVIPGGPAEAKENNARTKAADRKRKADLLVSGMEASTANVLDAIGKARELSKTWLSTGLGGSLTGRFAGTDTNNLAKQIDTIKSNLGFDKLAEMRASSPTGGALGAVTERELDLLQSVVASLDQSQTDEQLRENLDKVERHYRNTLARMKAAYAEDYADDQAQPSAGAGVPPPEDPLGIR